MKRASVHAGWDTGYAHLATRTGEYATESNRDADRCWFCRALCYRAPEIIDELIEAAYQKYLDVIQIVKPLNATRAGLGHNSWHDVRAIRYSAIGNRRYLPFHFVHDHSDKGLLIPESELFAPNTYTDAHQRYSESLLEWLHKHHLDVDWMIEKIAWGFESIRRMKQVDRDGFRAGAGQSGGAYGYPFDDGEDSMTLVWDPLFETESNFRSRAKRETEAFIARVTEFMNGERKVGVNETPKYEKAKKLRNEFIPIWVVDRVVLGKQYKAIYEHFDTEERGLQKSVKQFCEFIELPHTERT